MKTKLVEYSYASSPNAIALGFPKTGCYSVETRSDPMKPAKAVNGFETLEQAKAFAETLSYPWDQHTR